MSDYTRKCRCKGHPEMMLISWGEHKFWCPICGRFSQSFVCEKTKWYTPEVSMKGKKEKQSENKTN